MTPPKSYTVAEYMQTDVVSISQRATIREAVERLVTTNTNSLVIVDEGQRVVGMLSTIDIIAKLVPDYLEEDRHLASFEAVDVFPTRAKEMANEPVTTAMSKMVHTIQKTHTLIEAATLLSEHRINQLPVVDQQGALVGYIGRTNIKQALADTYRAP